MTLHVPAVHSAEFDAMVSRLGIALCTNTVTATVLALVRRADADLRVGEALSMLTDTSGYVRRDLLPSGCPRTATRVG